MEEDSFSKGEEIEAKSSKYIILLALISITVLYSGLVKQTGSLAGLGEPVSIILFSVLINLLLVFYQVREGKKINAIRKLPYI